MSAFEAELLTTGVARRFSAVETHAVETRWKHSCENSNMMNKMQRGQDTKQGLWSDTGVTPVKSAQDTQRAKSEMEIIFVVLLGAIDPG